ncbi:MAG: hypothetical protein ACOC6B_04070 [Thermodesulfobacteriota bacterium]
MKIQHRKIPSATLTYILVYAVVILAFISFVIYPFHTSLSQQDIRIRKLESRIEKQKILHPLYQELVKQLRSQPLKQLPFPPEGKLPRDKIDDIPLLFSKIAKSSGLQPLAVSPDLQSIAGNPDSLLLNAVVKGDFFTFRSYLIELGKIPYLAHIEQIQINPIRGGRKFMLKMQLALAG